MGMTTTTWIAGSVGAWTDASNWVGGIVPGSGDTAEIFSGEPQIGSGNPISNEQIILGGSPSASSVTLEATDATFENDTSIVISGASMLNASLEVAGTTSFNGQIYFQAPGGTLTIDLDSTPTNAADFALTGDGALISVGRENVLDLAGQGTITNHGTIEVSGIADVAADVSLAGTGSIVLQGGGKLSVEGTIGQDQTVYFGDGTGLLTIAQASLFMGTINVSLPGASTDLTNIDAQSEAYDASQHTLTLYAGPNQTGAILAHLDVQSDKFSLKADDFILSHPHGSDTLITFSPGGATVSAQSMPVPVVAAPGTKVSLADILQQSFGTTDPGFYAITLMPAPAPLTPVNATNVGYWGDTSITPTWYLNGAALAQDTRITMQQVGDVDLLVGNSMQPIEIKVQVTPDASGENSKFVDYDIL
jgi:hypothetical protein